jgi:hypothetical protein
MDARDCANGLHLLHNSQFGCDITIFLRNPKDLVCKKCSKILPNEKHTKMPSHMCVCNTEIVDKDQGSVCVEMTENDIISKFGDSFVEGEDVMRSHSLVLSVWSNILRLQYDTKRFGIRCIKAYERDIEKKTFRIFFRSFYYLPDCDPRIIEGYDLDNVVDLIKLSRLYGVTKIEDLCYDMLTNHVIEMNKVVNLLNGLCVIFITSGIDVENGAKRWIRFISTLVVRIVSEYNGHLDASIEMKDTLGGHCEHMDNELTESDGNVTPKRKKNASDSSESIAHHEKMHKSKKVARSLNQDFGLPKPDFSFEPLFISTNGFDSGFFIEFVSKITLSSLEYLNSLSGHIQDNFLDQAWITMRRKRMFLLMIYMRIILNHALSSLCESVESLVVPHKDELIGTILSIPSSGKPNIDMKFVTEFFKYLRTHFRVFYVANSDIVCILYEKITDCIYSRGASF